MAGTSSESGGSGCGEVPRLRSVRLARRPGPSKLGFSVRGGKEHRTGFFITAVEPASEAHLQGLQVGDQIIRVNGFPVEDATHKELLQLIQGHSQITLKVRSVGMIPVKEEDMDELTWRIVEPGTVLPPGAHFDAEELRGCVRLSLKVPPKAKLGCGICKGPEWKPGIFVQFTKENSIARLGGLRPGDQIIQCNNVLFTPDIPFNQAVSIMRGWGVLELAVAKGAGTELFPGESSGYNSSASSLAGDLSAATEPIQSHLPHRFMKENGVNGMNGMNGTNGTNGTNGMNGMNMNGIHGMNGVNGINGVNGMNGVDNEFLMRKIPEFGNGSTIIQVGGDTPDSGKSKTNSQSKLAEICMVSQQLETKTTTVLVEVHHSEDDSVSNTQSDVSTDRLTNSSVSSFTSSASSLSSAISQELERRSKRAPAPAPPMIPKPPTEKLVKSGLTKEELDQHEKLMQEFKRAHQKMFSDVKAVPREEEKCSGVKEKEPEKNGHMNGELKKEKTREAEGLRRNKKQPAPPPPPPPMPAVEPRLDGPPMCPTPDYDSLSLASDVHDSISIPPSCKSALPDFRNGKPLVTVREYGVGEKRQPARLEFLGGEPHLPASDPRQPVQSRLHSELSHTLAKAASNPTFNNNNKVSNNNLNNLCNEMSKSSVIKISVQPMGKQAPFYLFPNENGRRLNGNLHPHMKEMTREAPRPNGILKNSKANVSQVHIHPGLDKLPHKSIKFTGITTVIRETPEPMG